MNIDTLRSTPFNLELLQVDETTLKTIKEVTNISIFDNGGNFHQEGLFSIQ